MLAKEAGITQVIYKAILSNEEKVEGFIEASFLDEHTKGQYLQLFQDKLNQLREI